MRSCRWEAAVAKIVPIHDLFHYGEKLSRCPCTHSNSPLPQWWTVVLHFHMLFYFKVFKFSRINITLKWKLFMWNLVEANPRNWFYFENIVPYYSVMNILSADSDFPATEHFCPHLLCVLGLYTDSGEITSLLSSAESSLFQAWWRWDKHQTCTYGAQCSKDFGSLWEWG